MNPFQGLNLDDPFEGLNLDGAVPILKPQQEPVDSSKIEAINKKIYKGEPLTKNEREHFEAERQKYVPDPKPVPSDWEAYKGTKLYQEEADSYGNMLNRGIDGMKASVWNGFELLANKLDMPDLAKEFKANEKSSLQSVKSYPKPTVSPFATKEYADILDKFSEGEVIEGMMSMAKVGKAMSATALPYVLPSLGVALGTAVVTPVIATLPVVGSAAATITSVVAPLLPAFVMGSGQIYDEAKARGAAEEEATAWALGGGLVVGLIDRWSSGALVKGWLSAFGRSAVTREIGKEVGEAAAEEAVDTALKVGTTSYLKKGLKGFAKGGLREGSHEGAQAFVEEMSVAQASNTQPKDLIPKIIDAAALGIVGGGQVHGAVMGLSPHMKKEAHRRVREWKENDQELGKVNDISDQELELLNAEDLRTTGQLQGATKIVRRALSFLKPAAARKGNDEAKVFFNKLGNFYNNVNVAAGNLIKNFEDKAVTPVLKNVKVPFSPRAKKKVVESVGRHLRGPKHEALVDKKKLTAKELDAIKTAKIEARKILGRVDKNNRVIDNKDNPQSLFGILRKEGIPVQFMEDYLSNVLKVSLVPGVRQLQKQEILNILDKNPKTKKNKHEILKNIIDNHNVYDGTTVLNIFPEGKAGAKEMPITRKGFEFPRSLPPEVVLELDRAGLLENNFEVLIKKLIVSVAKRAELQRIYNEFKGRTKDLKLKPAEMSQVNNIFQAIQGNYQTIETGKIRKVNMFSTTAAYITTLSQAAITSLSEPIIVLSRVSPKHAIWGSLRVALTGLRKGVRTMIPKFPKSDLEQAFNGLLQVSDVATQNAIRDVADTAVARRVTDAYFKLNLLAYVTQMSRQIAFAAAESQMQEDLQTLELERQLGEETLGSVNARRRLREQGLSNIFGNKVRKLPKVRTEPVRTDFKSAAGYKTAVAQYAKQVQRRKDIQSADRRLSTVEQQALEWARGEGPAPLIMQRSLGKTVNETIMSPDAINRPLWQSSERLRFAALLKGFMTVFGNTVGFKMWNEVFKPLIPLHTKREGISLGIKDLHLKTPTVNPEATFRYALMFTLLMASQYGTGIIKDSINYDDPEDSPMANLEGFDLFKYLLRQTNAFGFSTILSDMEEGVTDYGQSAIDTILGPIASKFNSFVKSLAAFKSGNPKMLAKFITKNTPFIGSLSEEKGEDIPYWNVRNLRNQLEELHYQTIHQLEK